MELAKFVNIKASDNSLQILVIVSIGFLILSLGGLIFDKRILDYSPIWLKPLKFAISSLIFAITFIIFSSYFDKTRILFYTNWIISICLTIELIIISMQAYRGRMSHFNYTTVEDMILFQIMAVAITIVWIVMSVYVYNSFQTLTGNAILDHGMRVGLLISFLSMGVAFAMTKPGAEQIQKIQENKSPIGLTLGSHSVNEKDPSQKIPFTRWAKTGGDLRIAHFFGLHGMQILPLLAWILFAIGLHKYLAIGIIYLAGMSYLFGIIYVLYASLQGRSIYEILRIGSYSS
ncbi:hypothetical protein [Leptospira sp. GIMC2001]|uniref:hypothetical protein n=1 Tax=Leptospira sp. GIMC2001 TaxID=1513297 RepID=UPI00234AE537|nr:hypothetical protein [Leptospira sp. GIMC2001]WCL50859.1 hypothetical protein O4O04_08610 [Leptospira sp. GIMC2001]